MATLEDAAEQLVIKLKGLDSEIEESQQALEQGRDRVEETSREVEEEWSALTEALSSLLQCLRGEQGQLAGEAEEALRASADARAAVSQSAGEARAQIAGSVAVLDALGQHASGLEAGVETLIGESGEAPAGDLAARAQEVEQELALALEEACRFLQHDVVAALERLADDARQRCQALFDTLATEGAAALEATFDEWTAKVNELEEIVSNQGFAACQENASAVVAWALQECASVSAAHLQDVSAAADECVRPLRELAGELRQASTILAGGGESLRAEIDTTRGALVAAQSALDSVRERLATFSFVQG